MFVLGPNLYLYSLSYKHISDIGKHPFNIYLAGDQAPLIVALYIVHSVNLQADTLIRKPDPNKYGVDISDLLTLRSFVTIPLLSTQDSKT